ncbi:hypothetical protein CHU98_g10833 [Xylaria longipes]|nr:hypothetical protein CHU98_g10833 [Xylaria longipes]
MQTTTPTLRRRYNSILWFEWFFVGLYDVRYLADCALERGFRAIHMGVMVGFSVVSVNYTPDKQKRTVFQATLTLTARYSVVLWHIRHKQGKTPIVISVALNAIAAALYLVEAFSQLGLSLRYQVLSFDGTHLTERTTTATLFMLGEGVNSLAENIVIVDSNGWTSSKISNLAAGVATVYVVFMIYFDWVAGHQYLVGVRQRLWAMLHLPFHIILLLFSEGSVQFVLWWKIFETLRDVGKQIDAATSITTFPEGSETQTIVDALNSTIWNIWDIYPPMYDITYSDIDQFLHNISMIPSAFWIGGNISDETPYDSIFLTDLLGILTTIGNSIFVTYKIDPIENIADIVSENASSSAIENAAFDASAPVF